MRLSSRAPGLLFAILVVLILVAPARAETMNLKLRFESSNQSMWGPGTAAKPGPILLEFVPGMLTGGKSVSWSENPSGLFPGIVTKDTYLFGDVTFGIDGDLSTAGDVSLTGTLNLLDPGSVDVVYPAEPSLTFPDQNDFVAGDIVVVSTSYKRGDGWALTTRSPTGNFSLDGRLLASIEFFANVCFIGCIDTESGALELWPKDELAIDSRVDMPEMSPFLYAETGVPFSENSKFIGATAVVPEIRCARDAQPPTGCESEVSGSHDLKAGGSGRFLGGQEEGVFATANIHVAAMIKKVIDKKFKKKHPWIERIVLEGRKEEVLGYATIDWTILAIDLATLLRAEQEFEFKPDLKVRLQFPRALEYWLGSAPETHMTGDFAEIAVGETLHIQTPSDSKLPMEIEPTFRLDNRFSAKTLVKTKETLPLRAADLDIDLPPFTLFPKLCTPGGCTDLGLTEVCVPRICTDPVVYNPPNIGDGNKSGLVDEEWSLTGWYDLKEFPARDEQSWQLEGFTPLPAKSFALDPENPIIRMSQVTGLITRPGEGRRIVPLVIDIWNGGDVPLGSLALQNSIRNAFPDVFNVAVDRVLAFGVARNPAYDGKDNVEILAPPVFIGHPVEDPPPGNAVLVEAPPKRLIVYASVTPRPDPPLFTSNSSVESASPLHTEVTASASSTADLGPGQPKNAGDFVLFGTHFVRLQSAGRIDGDVGSNDFVEVKQGASGIVAGDLRAGRVIRVNGSISADYGFAGGIIDVVGKGALRLFGSKKERQEQTRFALTSPKFAPPTPLLGDVWVGKGETRTIPPGHYGNVTVTRGGALRLEAGTSHIRSLHLEAGAHATVGGPATLVLADFAIAPDAVLTSTGWSRDVVIHALQTYALEVGPKAALRGALVAPLANVIFGEGSRLEGSAFGRSITLSPGASASYHTQCDTAIDADCDGAVDDPSAGS